MSAALLPVAHAGHWLAGLAYAMPVFVLLAVIAGALIVARRQESNHTGEEANR